MADTPSPTATADKAPAASPAPTAAPAAAPAAPASTPAAPKTALDALKGAETRLSQPDPSSGKPVDGVTPPAGAKIPPADHWEGIPEPRKATILANIRAENQARIDALTAQLAPFKDMDPQEVRTALEMLADFRKDPYAFWDGVGGDLRAHPDYKSRFQPPQEDPEPPPDKFGTDDKGQRVELYSAAQQKKWAEWNNRQIEKKLDEKVKPLSTFVDSAQTAEERREVQSRMGRLASEVMTEMRTLPHFTKENEPKILERLQKIPREYRRQVGSVAALHMAYNQFLKEEVFPNISAEAERKIREEGERKAAASSGSVKPNGTTGVQTVKRPSNPKELAEHMREIERRQTAGT